MDKKDLTNEIEGDIIEEESGRVAVVRFPCGEALQIFVEENQGLDLDVVADEQIAVFSLPFPRCEDCSIRTGNDCAARFVEYGDDYFIYKNKGKQILSFVPIPREELLEYFEIGGDTKENECEFL